MSILLVVFCQSFAAETNLRVTLEQAWSNYLKACNSGKESELEKTISSFRFGTMKNNLASVKRSLTPGLIKSMAEDAPDISKAKFVKLMENGSTAGLVYVKDSKEKDVSGMPRVTFTFIKFVKESGAWKVDGEMNIGSPKFQKNGKESEFDPAELPPTYQIDGKVRKSPENISAPDISGQLNVSSYGYKTEVAINEGEQKTILNKSYAGLIEKGLRKGRNSIVVRFTKIDDKTLFKPDLTIRRLTNDRKLQEVFKYEPKENIEGTHTFTFTVDE